MGLAEQPTGTDVPLLCALVAAAATGDAQALAAALARVRSCAVRVERIREALRLLVPYCGHPRALAAFTQAALPEAGSDQAQEADPVERARHGRLAFERVYGDSAARVLAGLARLDPLLPAWTLEHAYGRVLSRGELDPRERELLGVSVLAALGGLADPLLGHMRGALRLGASVAEVRAAVEAVPAQGAKDRREAALDLLARLEPRATR